MPQTKIYLRPIQKSLSYKLKEKCKWCSKEIPLNELQSHLVTCNCNVLDDNLEDEVMVLSDESRNDLKDYIANALSSATVSTKEVESLSIGQGGSVYPSPSVPLVASDIDSSPMLTFPSSCGNANQAEAGPSSSQGTSTISETHFTGNQTESSDSSPMLTFPSSSGNGNQAEAGPSSSQGISTISETHFIGSQTESTAHPLGPLTNNDKVTVEKLDLEIALIMPKIKGHIYSTGWIYL